MKGVRLNGFGDANVLQYTSVDRPVPRNDQLLIRAFATSVNRPDIIQRQGLYSAPKGESEILGLEVAGIVEEVGASVVQWNKGDRVFALVAGGGYAQYCTAYADHVMAIPASLSFNQAACICETYITAYLNLFLLAKLSDQQSVLLHGGGGGVNTAAIQLCQAMVPDSTIFVTCSTGKVEQVKKLGVDHVIDYQQQSFEEVLKEITNKSGVDVILDHIGAPYFKSNMKSLAVGGTLMQIAVSKGFEATINLALMMVKRQTIIGSVLRSRAISEKSDIIRQFSNSVMPLFEIRTIEPLISDVYPLSEAAKAHQQMEKSQHFGKIVLEID